MPPDPAQPPAPIDRLITPRSLIPIQRMPQQAHAGSGNDWTGITDPKVRKRLQDRIHQKRRRERQKARVTLSAATGPQAATLLQQEELPHASCYNAQQGVMVAAPQALPLHIASFTACEPDSERTEQFMQQFAADAHRALDHHLRLQQQQQQGGSSSPRADLLLSLIRFNTTRAIVLNARAMGITAALMMAPESRSLLPLPTTTAAEGAAADLSSAASALPVLLPPSLRPTALQLSVSHHPWVDVLPLPELRDNLLRRDERTYDKKELCRDLRGFQAVEDGRCGGMVVWGEAWDPRGWEVTDAFAEKWPWVVDGCHALWESTAHWRAVRSASL